jgi:hypothetical protein
VEHKRARGNVIAQRVLVSIAFVAGLTAWLTYASSHAYSPNADGATVVLEGLAITHGQLLLHGWSLSLDSFWSVDVPFYALGVAVFGVIPLLMHLIPALLLALCVLAGIALSWSGSTARQRIYGTVLLVLMLCLPGHTGAFYLLQGPWHVATTLYCLIAAFMLVKPTFGWRWMIAVVLLGIGLNGDFQMLAIGVIPVAVAGLFAMARRRSLAAGLTQLLASLTSCLLALVIRVVANAFGTFQFSESHHTVKLRQLLRDVPHFGDWITAIFGIHNGPVVGPTVSPLSATFRAVIFALVVLGFIAAIIQLVRGIISPSPGYELDGSVEVDLWRVDDLLLCMTLGAIGLFGLLTLSDSTSYARYLDPVAIFASVLAARFLPRFVTSFSSRVIQVIAGFIALTLVFCVISSVSAAGEKPPTAPTQQLENYLFAHHLTHGIGDYWAASIVTVDTKNAVIVRPVVANLSGEIVPDGRQASISWYQGQHFSFLVYQRDPYGRVNLATIKKTFGPPINIAHIGGYYYVVTWSHNLTLRLQPFP